MKKIKDIVSDYAINKEDLDIDDAKKKISQLESKVRDLEKNLLIENVQKKSFAEVAFQYGKQLNKTIGETKFLEMAKEISVVKAHHNPFHETNIVYSKDTEELITDYLSNKKYEFQNEFLPLFLSGKITMIGNKDYLYWFEAIDDWIKLSKSGNKDALKNLLVCFENGFGVEKNEEYKSYLISQIEGLVAEEPEYEEYFEFSTPERLAEKKIEKTEAFNVNKANVEINFLETEEFKYLKEEVARLYQQSSKIQTIHIKNYPSVDKLMEISRTYSFLPYDIKNELFGATIALHNSQFDFHVDNIKEKGGFLKKEKTADCSMKITNNSEWSCYLAISIKDNLGNTFNSKCKLNANSTSKINLFNKHPCGTKIDSIVFKTLEQDSKSFTFNPKNWKV